jgi:GDP-L-fucose synthase
MKGIKVLIAGGSGLVGTNLTKKLITLNADVLSSYCSTRPEQAFMKYYKQFDFTSFEDCLKATKDQDYVVLCASQVYGAEGMKNSPTATILSNLRINAGILEACSKNQVKRVIFISSSTVYHETAHPIAENELDLNIQPYPLYQGVGWFNRYMEQLVLLYQKVHQLKITALRVTNVYGPHDQFEEGKSHVLPALIKRALEKEIPYIVWGDGYTVRDFIYVEDLVHDIIGVLNSQHTECMNVCNGTPINIREAVDVILRVCSHNVEPIYDPKKPTAIPYRAINQAKFESLFGVRKRTSFESGIEQTENWYQNSLSKKQP